MPDTPERDADRRTAGRQGTELIGTILDVGFGVVVFAIVLAVIVVALWPWIG